MSADDYMLVNRVENQVNFMELHSEYAMGYGKTIYVDQNSKEIGYSDSNYFKSGFIFNDLIRFKFHPPAPSYIFKTSIFAEVGLYDENIKYIEDRYMNIKIAQNHQIGFQNEFMTYHRQHSNNLTKTAPINQQIEDNYYILKQYATLPGYGSIMNDFHLQNFYYYSGVNIKYGFRFMFLALPKLFSMKYLKSIYRLARTILKKF
jgi:hypothetical protein